MGYRPIDWKSVSMNMIHYQESIYSKIMRTYTSFDMSLSHIDIGPIMMQHIEGIISALHFQGSATSG